VNNHVGGYRLCTIVICTFHWYDLCWVPCAFLIDRLNDNDIVKVVRSNSIIGLEAISQFHVMQDFNLTLAADYIMHAMSREERSVQLKHYWATVYYFCSCRQLYEGYWELGQDYDCVLFILLWCEWCVIVYCSYVNIWVCVSVMLLNCRELWNVTRLYFELFVLRIFQLLWSPAVATSVELHSSLLDRLWILLKMNWSSAVCDVCDFESGK